MIRRIIYMLKLIVVLTLILFFSACRTFEYSGDYPELFTIAVNSILGTQGGFAGRQYVQPELRVLDEDIHGRVLFMYSEDNDVSPVSFLIMQKVEGDYVYFYPHYNFFSDIISYIRRSPNDDKITTLKQLNSWNQELSDTSEFVRVRIVRQPEPGPIADETLVEAFRSVFLGSTLRSNQIMAYSPFLRADSYGRSIYLIFGPQWEYVDDEYVRSFVYVAILFQPDHSFDIDNGTLLITDLFNYQTDLRLFMEANGWDTPFYP